MINIAMRTEYSFGGAYAKISEVVDYCDGAVCIADDNGTFGHYQLFKLCKARNVKPIFGVRLQVVDFKVEGEKKWGPVYIFIAKTNKGLVELYKLVRKAYDNFYYHPHLEAKDVSRISDDIIVIAEYWHASNEDDINYHGLSVTSPPNFRSNKPKIAIQANRYIRAEDRRLYQLLTGERAENSTRPQHILSDDEHLALFGDQSAIDNTYAIADACDVTFNRSDNVKFKGTLNLEIASRNAAKRKGIDLSNPVYKKRYDHELELIKLKGYYDYFLIVASMIKDAKKTMLVGPSRGSSAGSLICYLLDITEIDPIKYDLLFERFIDINREDLPDIDIDLPDLKRGKVIKQLSNIYGDDHVAHIATVSRLKPKSVLGVFAKNLHVPIAATNELKDAIIERSTGDARASMCVMDTLETTDVGKRFINDYPKMRLAAFAEGHASHTGVHAAGMIVCNDPLTMYGGVNSRDNVIMFDYREAEGLNLLKIDCLGLRTLTILEEVADRIGMKYADYYNLRLDDPNVFKIFNDMRLFGIFQFDGYALQSVTRTMGVENFNDIAAITALARPGPIHSGGTNLFIQRKIGKEPVSYLSQHPAVVEATKDTYGIIIYQEQLMKIAREYGGLTWEDVSMLRKAMGKSLGEEFFNRYKGKFMEGARTKGVSDLESDHVWRNMMTFGSWGFNKSHAISYGVVSYWTAWAKAYYPMEFAAANMNNSKGPESAVKILRDLTRNEGVKYVPFDPDESTDRWEISGDTLIGSLTNIPGIGSKKAKDIVERRAAGKLTKNQITKLLNAETPFDVLFPAAHYWGDIYKNYVSYGFDSPIDLIENIKDPGEYVFIAMLVEKNLRDVNEYQSVVKRGGEIIESDTLFLHLTFEDDTDSIIATIDRFRFEKLGRKLAERGVEGKDWYLISGYIKDEWRRIYIREIVNLWEWKASNVS